MKHRTIEARAQRETPRREKIMLLRWHGRKCKRGRPVAPDRQSTTSSGIGLIRPLEAAAKKLGAQILLEHRMTGIIRANPTSDRVIGITASNQGKSLNIRARKAVIIATGGSTG